MGVKISCNAMNIGDGGSCYEFLGSEVDDLLIWSPTTIWVGLSLSSTSSILKNEGEAGTDFSFRPPYLLACLILLWIYSDTEAENAGDSLESQIWMALWSLLPEFIMRILRLMTSIGQVEWTGSPSR